MTYRQRWTSLYALCVGMLMIVLVSAVAYNGVDEIIGNAVPWALGYAIGRIGTEARESPSGFGWGGVGGSYACADTQTGVAFALTKNRLTADFSAAERIAGIVAREEKP
jgi:CubicO group peptidase (beta-lactamase class C family)